MNSGRNSVLGILWFVAAVCLELMLVQVEANPIVNVSVAYLTAIRGNLDNRQGLSISGAVQIAFNEIGSKPEFQELRNYVNISYKWYDTEGNMLNAVRDVRELLCNGTSAFFGPEGTSCHIPAVVAQSDNKPMISYKCSDPRASDLPNFASTEPTDTQITKSVTELISYYKWTQFSILYEEKFFPVALALKDEAKKINLTVNFDKSIGEAPKCCKDSEPCCSTEYVRIVINAIRRKTRIYVFIGERRTLSDVMTAMHAMQLFDKGENFVIHVDNGMYNEHLGFTYTNILSNSNKRDSHECVINNDTHTKGKSLLIVVGRPPLQNYTQFTKSVLKHNSEYPFNFATPFNQLFPKYVSVYAAYLYDAVIVYAKALQSLLIDKSPQNETSILDIVNNGTSIISKIKQMGSYTSITGSTVLINSEGYAEGNFSVLAWQKASENSTTITINNESYSCAYSMIPYGGFYFPDTSFRPTIFDIPTRVPTDKPTCGFENELCNSSNNKEAIAKSLAILLFCSFVILLSIYRKWKIDLEIEGLLWKIDPVELDYEKDNLIYNKGSTASAMSYESKLNVGQRQLFAKTVSYRNDKFRYKNLFFPKKRDLSREIMKEMRLLRSLRHNNVNSFIGAAVEPTKITILTDYCSKGSLTDILENDDIKLDKMFTASLVHDLIKGMSYLHNSAIVCHGNLKSSNCVVTSRWVLQVTDFGLHELRFAARGKIGATDEVGEHEYYRNLLWKAPEHLRKKHPQLHCSQKGDVYAFGIILHEIIGRNAPYAGCGYQDPKEIVTLVKKIPESGETPLRPNISDLIYGEDYVINCMVHCWAEQADYRPDFRSIWITLKRMKDEKRRNIVDQMMLMMEEYAKNLEELVNERTLQVFEEKRKTEDLLHRMLPKSVAIKLTSGYGVEPESYNSVTIYFSDIVGFTAMCAQSTPLEVVNFLNDLYTIFDRTIKGYEVYKVETIGDAYMVVSGLPIRNGDKHAGVIASMSLNLLNAIKSHRINHRPHETLQLRIGIHTGPVVAGVVGLTMPRYCLFGDTVNTASRMESTGEPLKIHISLQCKKALEKLGGYIVEERGLVNIKGKGQVVSYWLVGATETAVKPHEVDLSNIPPLFCGSRRSPKLVNGGGDSRRHSVLRGNSMDKGGASSDKTESMLAIVCPPRMSTPTYLANRTNSIDNNKYALYPSTRVSTPPLPPPISIAITNTTPPAFATPVRKRATLREMSYSFDPLPDKRSYDTMTCLKKRSCHSLQDTTLLCGEIGESDMTSNCETLGNGGIHYAPLLTDSKKWRSFEDVPFPCHSDKKKLVPKSSIRSWILNLFNPGNNNRNSDMSLTKQSASYLVNLQIEEENVM